jgi:hypothetical protein
MHVIPALLPLGQSMQNAPQPAVLESSVLVSKTQSTSVANGPNSSVGKGGLSS